MIRGWSRKLDETSTSEGIGSNNLVVKMNSVLRTVVGTQKGKKCEVWVCNRFEEVKYRFLSFFKVG